MLPVLPMLALAAVAATTSTLPQQSKAPPAMATAHSLNTTDPGAVCLNGEAASVAAWLHPAPSTDWVIQIGSASPVSSSLLHCLVLPPLTLPPSFADRPRA